MPDTPRSVIALISDVHLGNSGVTIHAVPFKDPKLDAHVTESLGCIQTANEKDV